ncbi:MAG: hypothetical protein H7A38_07095 [Chlamydiales bacterium]|nr:hypothetical protein [Chlamydiales bacterium]
MKKLATILSLSALCYGANGTHQTPQSNSNSMQVSSDCSHLSSDEQQFASQLSDMHRTMFCRHFSVSQRIEAMTLASSEVEKLTGQKTNITPDEAVEAVMKTARQNQKNETSGQQSSSQQQQQNPYSNYGSSNGKGSNPYSNY